MIEHIVEIKENKEIAKKIFKMKLSCDFANKIKPGQFINIAVQGFILRRPISVSDIGKDEFTIIYKIVGEGTEKLSKMRKGETLNVLGPLGRFFSIHENEEDILIIGGGIGIPPLYEVAKEYRKIGKNVVAVLGFNDTDSAYLYDEFENLGCKVYIATMDGSFGIKGNVIDVIERNNLRGFIYSCGPEVMLKAVENKFKRGYISKESRMACGIGACMGCVCKDKSDPGKYYRICKEGPVFEIGKVE